MTKQVHMFKKQQARQKYMYVQCQNNKSENINKLCELNDNKSTQI